MKSRRNLLRFLIVVTAAGLLFFSCPGSVKEPPVITITTQPTPETNVTVGSISGDLTVTAGVTHNAALSYQWQQSSQIDFAGNTNTGTNDPALAIPAGLTAGTYYFRCIVSAKGAKSQKSDTAAVNVAARIPEITITAQPAPVTNVTVGSIRENLSMSAVVTPGAPLYYQWYSNTFADNSSGSVIYGATLPSYFLPPTLPPGIYYYFCEVASTDAVFVRSAVAVVTVTAFVEMISVPGGSYVLGRDLGVVATGDVTPVSTVTLTGFHIGKYPVTQAQYQSVMGANPSYFTTANGRPPEAGEIDENRPVEQVNWYDTLVFCNTLSLREGLTPAYSINGSTNPAVWGTAPTEANAAWDAVVLVSGSTGYRLPTEAQWEYAAKGGNGSLESFTYSGSNNIDEAAWYNGNSGGMTHEAGKMKANGLGIYDMSGNIYEWCRDFLDSYSNTTKTDPVDSYVGPYRVMRGGCWRHNAVEVRSVCRYGNFPFNNSSEIGFRVCRP